MTVVDLRDDSGSISKVRSSNMYPRVYEGRRLIELASHFFSCGKAPPCLVAILLSDTSW